MRLEETRIKVDEMSVRAQQWCMIVLTSEFHFAGCEHERNARRNARRGRYDRGMAEGGDGRNARRGTHVGGMAGGRARQGGMAGGMEGGHDRGAWQGHGGRARQGAMTGGMAGEHDRGMTGGTSSRYHRLASLPRVTPN